MKIIVDAFGGDHAPLAVIEGCRQAVDELGAEILLTGDEEKIRQAAAGAKISLDGMEIVHAPSVIPVEEDPTTLLKKYADSSMAVGLRLLSEGKGEAFVSAGSTGALVVGSTLVVKRVKGVRRIAIGTLVPNAGSGYLLVDAGANHDCRPEMLLQFALMGSAYMEKVQGIQKPRVGLVNIGTEENKGTQLQLDVLPLLKEAPIHFTGNVEARGLPLGEVDVAVTDGFTGNIILKTSEGMGKFFSNELKSMVKSFPGMLGAPFLAGKLRALKKKSDSNEAGGAPLLGLRKPVIKAHGSSNAKAFKNCHPPGHDLPAEQHGWPDRRIYGTLPCSRGCSQGGSSRRRGASTVREMHELEKTIGYEFKNEGYLRTALTHSSYANEMRSRCPYNERQEFLGDAVLSIIVSDYLFKSSHLAEGDLTKLRASIVCEKSLWGWAKEIHLGDYILLGKGEENSGGRERPSIQADAFEALIAAVYLDSGMERTREFLMPFVLRSLENEEKPAFKDYKTLLQEIVQKNPEEQLSYELVEERGPDHDKTFVVQVKINSNIIGRGEGKSKKAAEQMAAKEAVELMGE